MVRQLTKTYNYGDKIMATENKLKGLVGMLIDGLEEEKPNTSNPDLLVEASNLLDQFNGLLDVLGLDGEDDEEEEEEEEEEEGEEEVEEEEE